MIIGSLFFMYWLLNVQGDLSNSEQCNYFEKPLGEINRTRSVLRHVFKASALHPYSNDEYSDGFSSSDWLTAHDHVFV